MLLVPGRKIKNFGNLLLMATNKRRLCTPVDNRNEPIFRKVGSSIF